MKIYVKLKSLANKKPIINSVPIEIEDNITNANDLIACIVKDNVRRFNALAVDKPLFSYLTNEQLSNDSQSGKIGFDDKKNSNHQDEQQALTNALTCFEDGIYKVYIGDDEIVYGQTIKINENDELTFIRLTMLAGRLW